MTEIHMDVDSVRAVIQLLARKKGELEGFISGVSRDVDGLEGVAWIGEAPAQFFYEYAELREDLMEQVRYTQTLADRLTQAIADYEAAAAKLD